MDYIEAKCPICAKDIPIPSDINKPYCAYCGAQFLKDAALAFAGVSIAAGVSGLVSNNPTDFTIVGGTLVDYRGSDAEVVIPDGVSCIGKDAFKGNKAVVSLVMPDTVTSIDDQSFYDCSSLKTVAFSNSIVTIGCSAFEKCKSLSEVTLPRTTKTIGNWCFEKCISMTVANIPSNASCPSDVFKDCPAKIVRI